MEGKEYVLRCGCGAKYIFQGEKDDLEKFMDSQIWICDLGRHIELESKRNYLQVIEEHEHLSIKAEIESKKENEYTVRELQKEFGTAMEHIGFGVFKDPEGNVWDYRLGEKGERLYSKTV